MVRLTRIYTRGGDRGETALGDGTRVSKAHPRIRAGGTVDELNAMLGMVVRQIGAAPADRELLRGIQNDLFDLGADLCVPERSTQAGRTRLRVEAAQVKGLEAAIDARNARLQALSSFVLPGGSNAAAWFHLARTVCRRAEVEVVQLCARESVNGVVVMYLNRLSDLLFVMARCANRDGRADILWRPGAGRAEKQRRADSAPQKPARSGGQGATRAAARRSKRKAR